MQRFIAYLKDSSLRQVVLKDAVQAILIYETVPAGRNLRSLRGNKITRGGLAAAGERVDRHGYL